MDNVDHQVSGDLLTIFLKGHIDSANAPEVEDRITEIRGSVPHQSVVMDLQDLQYISSAGLRIILRLRKRLPDLKLINVSQDIYEILEMTGFTEMIEVEKAYRRLSVEGCEIIGEGANGKVYRIDRDTIVKVYMNPDALPDIKRERELARKAFVLGVPTAIPYDVVRVGEGYGSVFELLNASSFAQILKKEPERFEEIAEMSADLLIKIHSTELNPGDMPDMRETALKWAAFLEPYLDADLFKKLYALVEAVPEDHHMLHGDYHLKNVMLQDGEALLIDMDTLCMGHPIFEFGSVYNAYCGFSALNHENILGFLGIDYETAGRLFKRLLELYLKTEDEKRLQEVVDKAEIVGLTRLLRRAIRRGGLETEEGRKQIEYYTSELQRLVPLTETLCF
ncbi:MAG: anti-sigma factor antagonist [Lachnospiraceae bacterium]|nr:anti-sigma factor antagonist [Lachnospiraceae bacterium]